MTTIQAMPGRGAGFVRAVFSGRCRGFAAPVDLLRVLLRSANRLSAIRHNEAVYARLSEDFGGYLVTDSDPCEMTAAEMAACWPFDDREKVFAFSDSRGDYAPPFVRAVLCSGFSWGVGDGGGPLDAPGHMAAGAMRWIDGFGWFPVVCDGPGI